MATVINLNRFRKKKAREEKEKRAERNRRVHGRTKAERAADEAERVRFEKKLDGAFLVRDRVAVEDLPSEDAARDLEFLSSQADDALTLSELSAQLRVERLEQSTRLSTDKASQEAAGDGDVPTVDPNDSGSKGEQ
jgi:hypothetical protein